MRILYNVLFFIFCSFSVCAQAKIEKDKILKKSIEEGAFIYEDFCVNCHMPDGKGVDKVFPPLAKSDFLNKQRKLSIKAVKFGLKGKIVVNGKTYNGIMTPLGLSDQEVSDVLNYISTSWGNSNRKKFTKEEIIKITK